MLAQKHFALDIDVEYADFLFSGKNYFDNNRAVTCEFFGLFREFFPFYRNIQTPVVYKFKEGREFFVRKFSEPKVFSSFYGRVLFLS